MSGVSVCTVGLLLSSANITVFFFCKKGHRTNGVRFRPVHRGLGREVGAGLGVVRFRVECVRVLGGGEKSFGVRCISGYASGSVRVPTPDGRKRVRIAFHTRSVGEGIGQDRTASNHSDRSSRFGASLLVVRVC